MSNYSPLRYPGGKGKLAPYIKAVLEMNDLEGAHYAEPFAGGAAVALDLLLTERVKHIHINDLDWAVYAFWAAAVHQTDELIRRIYDTPVSIDSWLEARQIKKDAANHDITDVGFATFFLNRTNRSGILNGGVIGGLAQRGAWKIDCRMNKTELIDRISRIGIFQSRISVTNLDAVDFISLLAKSSIPRSLIYIDPPYYIKGAYLYRNHFSHADHVALAEAVKGIQHHSWIVSYDNVEQIHRIYSQCDREEFSIGYSARNHGKGSEVMIFDGRTSRPPRVFASKAEFLRASKPLKNAGQLAV